jgi:hypothetical protein
MIYIITHSAEKEEMIKRATKRCIKNATPAKKSVSRRAKDIEKSLAQKVQTSGS